MAKLCLMAVLVTSFTVSADVLDNVDPFVGTSANGHTTPAAAYPFGMVQPGPDTGHVRRCAVWIQFEFSSPTEIGGYKWYTANDHEERDPSAWRLLGSNDGVMWKFICGKRGFKAPSQRNAHAFSESFKVR